LEVIAIRVVRTIAIVCWALFCCACLEVSPNTTISKDEQGDSLSTQQFKNVYNSEKRPKLNDVKKKGAASDGMNDFESRKHAFAERNKSITPSWLGEYGLGANDTIPWRELSKKLREDDEWLDVEAIFELVNPDASYSIDNSLMKRNGTRGIQLKIQKPKNYESRRFVIIYNNDKICNVGLGEKFVFRIRKRLLESQWINGSAIIIFKRDIRCSEESNGSR
jgi:hypothetical protein